MGIAVGDLLMTDFFKDFEVIAGKKGLDREIQGFAVFEAPDCYRWAVGKELIFSSGYVLAQEPDSIRKSFEESGWDKTAGFIIKRGRYLKEIPEDMIALFDQHNIPLITMPFAMSWMELMNQVNVTVMNQTIRRFSIWSNTQSTNHLTYKEQKIRKILQAVEIEMEFPAFLYDVTERKSYYSSSNFKRITEQYGLEESDYWMPSIPYSQHILCDYINMSRFRLKNQNNVDGPRVSWVLIPIMMGGITYAYFVVMESRDFLDFYDEYSIRIAYMMLQGVYEQTMLAWDAGNIGFENFIHTIMNDKEEDKEKILYQANTLGISMNTRYACILFRQKNEECSARMEREHFINAMRKSGIGKEGRLAFLDENEGAILIDVNESIDSNRITAIIKDYQKSLEKECEEMKLEFGVCRKTTTLAEIRQTIQRCQKVVRMGRILYPDENIWYYEDFGLLAWIQVPEEELEEMLCKYKELLKEPKNAELLKTLKVYLENNMNYSTTAEKLYLNINTIRKRIDKINNLISLDWENHVQRLEMELLLQFLDL